MIAPYNDLAPGEGDIRQNWRPINEARSAIRSLERNRRESLEALANVRRRQIASDPVHPFKIYLARQAFAGTQMPADRATWWRTICVRTGRIGNIPMVGAGCDGHDANPDDDFYPQETDDGNPIVPITVPDNTPNYYLWITLTGSNPPSPTLASGTNITGTWQTFPSPDGIHWLVAVLDSTRPYELIVRQILRADVTDIYRPVDVCENNTLGYRWVIASDFIAGNPPENPPF